MSEAKKWSGDEFWGLGFEWDPQWLLTPEQIELQAKLIALCANTLRENAVESDRKLLFPRKNFEALAKLGLLGLTVPKEWGGLGQDHTGAAMVVETIARYGCPSTAMCYTMHLGAVAACLLRGHGNAAIEKLMSRLDREVLIGTLSYSDPETGWTGAGKSEKKLLGQLRGALLIGMWSRPPVRISAVTIPISPASS
jgi:alkylation response protein AidB-like acyl-CoA dehydrogenase